VIAVVKADGYGHGAVAVGRAALAAGAVELGVATVGEALAVRAGGITAPVIAWLHTPSTDFGAAAADVCSAGGRRGPAAHGDVSSCVR
jgi:alanine racemase